MTKKRPSTARTLALLCGVAACAFAAHQAAVEIASARLAALLGAGVASRVTVDPFSGQVTLDGVKLGGLSAGRVTLRAAQASILPQFIAPALALDGSAVAENVTIDTGYLKYSMPRIEAAGTALTGDDLTQLFNKNSGASMVERFEKLTAASITIPLVKADGDVAGAKQAITYSDLRFVDVVKGKIGAMASSGGTVTAADPKGQTLKGTYGTITGKNIDMAATARMMTQARTDDSEPLKVLYEAVTVDNYVISAEPAVEISIGSMAIRDIKGRATKVPMLDLLPMLANAKEMKDPSPEMAMKLGGFAVDLLRSFEIGGVEMRDMTVKLPPESGVKTFKVGRFAMNGFAQGRLGEYVFEGFDIDAKDGKAKLGQFALRGLGFKSALDALDAALARGPAGLDTLDPKGMIPTLDQIVFSGLDFDVPDEKAKQPGSRIKFTLGKIEYTGSNFINGVPSTAGLGMEKFFMDLTSSKDPQFNELKAAGFKALDMSARLDVAWIEAAKTLAIKQTGGLAGMGGIAFKGSLGNVTKDIFSLDEGLTQAAALGVLLMDAEFKLDNSGLFERALEVEAKKEKKSVDQLRKDWISAAAVGIPTLLDNSPAAKAIANAVAKFVAQPKNLRIGGKSAQGLGVADLALLGSPADLLKKISVTAAANE